MAKLVVSLHIPLHRYLAYYQGKADEVVATAHDGRNVRFPARVLRPFLTHRGIIGTFAIEYGPTHKFVSIQRVSVSL